MLLRLLPPLRTEYRLVTYSSIIVKMQLLEKKNLQQLAADCRIISSRHTVVAVRLKADQLFNEYLTLITQPIPGEELEEPREALRAKIIEFLKTHELLSSEDPMRELQIIKLTPIALARCRGCGRQFTSNQAVEDDAELEMSGAFDRHRCGLLREPNLCEE